MCCWFFVVVFAHFIRCFFYVCVFKWILSRKCCFSHLVHLQMKHYSIVAHLIYEVNYSLGEYVYILEASNFRLNQDCCGITVKKISHQFYTDFYIFLINVLVYSFFCFYCFRRFFLSTAHIFNTLLHVERMYISTRITYFPMETWWNKHHFEFAYFMNRSQKPQFERTMTERGIRESIAVWIA